MRLWGCAALALAGCGARPLEAPRVEEVFARGVPSEVRVSLVTELGAFGCTLAPRRAPRAAALFVGLARGVVDFRDARTGAVVRRPYYDGLTFRRRIPDALVQSGCPLGDGTGTPGYRIPIEPDPSDAARLERPGALLLATYTPPPGRRDPSPPRPGEVVGSQFVVGLRSMAHVAGRVTVLGECDHLEVVAALARVPRGAVAPRVLSVRVEGGGEREGPSR